MNYRTENIIAGIVLSIFITTIGIGIGYFYSRYGLEPGLIIHIMFLILAISINMGVLFNLYDKIYEPIVIKSIIESYIKKEGQIYQTKSELALVLNDIQKYFNSK